MGFKFTRVLPDSYTVYKNKIGLTDNYNEIISLKNDVTLVWPFKDCVLEGGQTEEDEKRNEVFYNETLAPDQVTRLLYPKVFSNARRYSYNVENEHAAQSAEFKNSDITCVPTMDLSDDDSLIIKGNNLLVLSSLLKRFENQIQLIYIEMIIPKLIQFNDYKKVAA